MTKNWLGGLMAVSVAGGMFLFQGCEVDSANDVQRTVGVNFTGFYRNPNGSNITTRNSGVAITSLDLRQGGDRLEAIDNSGNIWKGSIGDFNGQQATFDLTGKTTAGIEGLFSGTLTTSDGSSTQSTAAATSAKGTMTGTYIEDGFYAAFLATATIPGTTPGGGGGGGGTELTVSPGSTTLNSNGATAQFTVSGGNGSYTWSVSSTTFGSVIGSGSSATYTRTAPGNNTLTVRDTGGKTGSATITQP